MDDNGHGTHVAGTLAAEKNGYLVVGVAPAVDLYALKILGATGEGEVSDLILALQWAVDNDMDIVNMSLGTHEVSPALETAVANASTAGPADGGRLGQHRQLRGRSSMAARSPIRAPIRRSCRPRSRTRLTR